MKKIQAGIYLGRQAYRKGFILHITLSARIEESWAMAMEALADLMKSGFNPESHRGFKLLVQ